MGWGPVSQSRDTERRVDIPRSKIPYTMLYEVTRCLRKLESLAEGGNLSPSQRHRLGRSLLLLCKVVHRQACISHRTRRMKSVIKQRMYVYAAS